MPSPYQNELLYSISVVQIAKIPRALKRNLSGTSVKEAKTFLFSFLEKKKLYVYKYEYMLPVLSLCFANEQVSSKPEIPNSI